MTIDYVIDDVIDYVIDDVIDYVIDFTVSPMCSLLFSHNMEDN